MPVPPKENARLVPRASGCTIGPIRLTGPAGPFSATVQDISIIGIGLVGDVECPAGTSFVIEGGPKGKLLDALTAELRHATQRTDGRWLWGCSFSRHLTSDDVEVLG
jgi:PilZ domain